MGKKHIFNLNKKACMYQVVKRSSRLYRDFNLLPHSPGDKEPCSLLPARGGATVGLNVRHGPISSSTLRPPVAIKTNK